MRAVLLPGQHVFWPAQPFVGVVVVVAAAFEAPDRHRRRRRHRRPGQIYELRVRMRLNSNLCNLFFRIRVLQLPAPSRPRLAQSRRVCEWFARIRKTEHLFLSRKWEAIKLPSFDVCVCTSTLSAPPLSQALSRGSHAEAPKAL
jgi:hypothetical protein